MRILLGVHALAPTSLGGTEQAVSTLAHSLAERHQVLLFYPHPHGMFAEGTEEQLVRPGSSGGQLELRGRTLERRAGFLESFASPAAERWFQGLLEEHRPDVVHLHHLSGLSFRLPALARAAGVPVVFTAHDYFWSCARGQRLNLELKRCTGPTPDGCATCMQDQLVLEPGEPGSPLRAVLHTFRNGLARFAHRPSAQRIRQMLEPLAADLRALTPLAASPSSAAQQVMLTRTRLGLEALLACDRVLVPSDFHRHELLQVGIPDTRCLLMPNSLRPAAGMGLVPVERTPHRPLRVGFIGALIPSKGPHILLEALERARQPAREPGSLTGTGGGRFHATLVGPSVPFHRQPRYGQLLAERAASVGATLHGPSSSTQVHRLLETLDVLVVPSIWDENAPTVLLEAFQHGVPVVASSVGGIPERVRDGDTGLLVPPGDPEALCRALIRLEQDPKLWRRLARGAWEEGQRLASIASASNPAERHEALYTALLEGRQRPGL